MGDSIPDVDEIARKTTALFLINQHYSLTGVKPYTPNVIEVGGLQIQPAKKLDEVNYDLRILIEKLLILLLC